MDIVMWFIGIGLLMVFSWLSFNVKRVGDVFRDGLEEILNSISPRNE